MGNIPILNLPIAIGLNGSEWIPLVQGGTTKRAQGGQIVDGSLATNFPAEIAFVSGINGYALTAGRSGWLPVPFDCTITTATLLADRVGSVQIDIWKSSYGGFPTISSANSITGGNPPVIAAGVQYRDATLNGWTKSILGGEILLFNVDSASTVQEVTISLSVARSLL